MPAVALTDHGSLAGAVELVRETGKHGVKPLIGCEVYVADDRRQQKKGYAHLTLLAENNDGYRNLLKLSSAGYLEGYYYKPRVDWELLEQHSNGLVALSGCLSGRVCKALEESRPDDARADLDRLAQVFGRDSTYVEIQNAGIDVQAQINPALQKLAAEAGLPLVATGDVHYLRHEDAQAHEALLCVQSGDSLKNPNHWKFDTDQFFFKSEQEIAGDFPGLEDAMRRTLEIAERCNVELELGTILLPKYPVPDDRDAFDYLVELCEKGLLKRYGKTTPELQERLRFELKTIKEMGFADYFLIVWDFVNFAKRNGDPGRPGPRLGRGLARRLLPRDHRRRPDPLRPALRALPQPGPQVAPGRRHRLLGGRPRARDQLRRREVRPRPGRPDHHLRHDDGPRCGARCRPRARDPVRHRRQGREAHPGRPEGLPGRLHEARPGAQAGVRLRPLVREIVDLAKPLEGLVRQDSIHAAGVVIADRPLTDVVPLQQKGADQEVVTQFSGGDVEAVGLLKIDFLGLRNLDVIDKAVELVGGGLDITKIPMDDRKTYEMLARADSIGVFQFESSGMREALRQVKPTEFEDLIALVALYRPGPMAYIPTYARRKNGQEQVTFIDPRLEEITAVTGGICIYQEQYLDIAKKIAGFSPGEADDLRKAIGKKIHSLMASLKEKFLEGCAASGTTPAVANQLWKDMEQSQDYSFNKAHSACYALTAYRTAWLKANHPHEYMAALISSVMNTKDRVPFYVNACREMGIDVLPPDVNFSQCDFAVVEGRIRFGLNAVKNVGDSAARAIVAARQEGAAFSSLWDFTERVDPQVVNKRALESLVKCGATRLDRVLAARDARSARARPLARPARAGRAAARPGVALRPGRREAGPPADRQRGVREERPPAPGEGDARPLRQRAPARGDPGPAPAQDRRVTRRARAAARRRHRDGRRNRLRDQAADDEEGRPDGLHAPRRRPRQRGVRGLQLGLRGLARAAA